MLIGGERELATHSRGIHKARALRAKLQAGRPNTRPPAAAAPTVAGAAVRSTRCPAQALYAELLAGAAVADALRAAGRAAPALAAAYHCAHLSGGEVAWLGASPDT